MRAIIIITCPTLVVIKLMLFASASMTISRVSNIGLIWACRIVTRFDRLILCVGFNLSKGACERRECLTILLFRLYLGKLLKHVFFILFCNITGKYSFQILLIRKPIYASTITGVWLQVTGWVLYRLRRTF